MYRASVSCRRPTHPLARYRSALAGILPLIIFFDWPFTFLRLVQLLEMSLQPLAKILVEALCVNQDDGDISSRNHQQKSRREFGGYFLQSSSCYIWYVLKRDLSIKDLVFVIFGRIMWTVGLTCLLDLPDNDESRKHMQSKHITSLSDSLKMFLTGLRIIVFTGTLWLGVYCEWCR